MSEYPTICEVDRGTFLMDIGDNNSLISEIRTVLIDSYNLFPYLVSICLSLILGSNPESCKGQATERVNLPSCY